MDRPVRVVTGDPRLTALQEAQESFARRRALQVAQPFGVPVGPVRGGHSAAIGQIVLCDSRAGAVSVRLPVIEASQLGGAVAVANANDGAANAIYVEPPPGVRIDGGDGRRQLALASYNAVLLVAVSTTEYRTFATAAVSPWAP